MALTSKQLVAQLQGRLSAIDAQIVALQEERALLTGATAGLRRGTKRKAALKQVRKATGKRTVSKAAKAKQSKLRTQAWADVHKLHKAGKIAKADLASRAAYYKAHPKG